VDWSEDDHRLARSLLPTDVEIVEVRGQRLPTARRGRHVTSAAYAVLLLAELFPSVGRVLYLDADVLVRDARIDELWASDLGSHPVGGVPALTQSNIASANGIVGWRALGLNPRAPMLNSGVLLFDLDQIRHSGLFERAMEYARSFSHVSNLADQFALNAALNGDWQRLALKYNCNYRQLNDTSGAAVIFDDAEMLEALDDPVIVHFLGRMKPWLQIPQDPFVAEWRSLAASLGFTTLGAYREPPTKRQLEEQVSSLTQQVDALEQRLRTVNASLMKVRASRSYRIGLAITSPIRWLRRIRKRISRGQPGPTPSR
jgi:lipopolysaccharide biosynthesis glycosyltransferase